jgi:small-conductance mechanosensitive channel
LDLGTQFAINQIVKYSLCLFSFVSIFEILGQSLTVVWGGLAALLVGLGLGLQQTFNDFFSSFVHLFERNDTVGNIIEVNGQVGRVKKIGLRTSTLSTKEGINLI